jgi:hypothetical protein
MHRGGQTACSSTRSHNTRPAAMDSLDVSNFDLNAILRGAQLTLVGGRSWSPLHRSQALTCASSKSSSPESGHLHVGPLPPSCHCCSSRDCHSSYCCRAGSLLPYSSTKDETDKAAGCRRTCAAMAPIAGGQHGPHYLGRERRQRTALSRAHRTTGPILPHDHDALRHAHTGPHVGILHLPGLQ